MFVGMIHDSCYLNFKLMMLHFNSYVSNLDNWNDCSVTDVSSMLRFQTTCNSRAHLLLLAALQGLVNFSEQMHVRWISSCVESRCPQVCARWFPPSFALMDTYDPLLEHTACTFDDLCRFGGDANERREGALAPEWRFVL